MEPLQYEKRGYLNEPFRLFHLADGSHQEIAYHYHTFHKIIILLAGRAGYAIEGEGYALQPGDYVLVGRGSIHRPIVEQGDFYERAILYISPEFLQEQTQQPEKANPLKHVEDTIEQNDNNFDGIINNTPTTDELEAKARSGEQISLAEYAAALKAEQEQGKEKKPGKKAEKKPSIRAQLKADKERAAQRKQARSKSQDLERS